MSLCAEDLKKLFERPDLECRAGMAFCTSPDSFMEDALAASRWAEEEVGAHHLRALYFFVILGGPLPEVLPLRLIQEAAGAVSAFLPAAGDFIFDVFIEDHIDGALILVIAGMAGG